MPFHYSYQYHGAVDIQHVSLSARRSGLWIILRDCRGVMIPGQDRDTQAVSSPSNAGTRTLYATPPHLVGTIAAMGAFGTMEAFFASVWDRLPAPLRDQLESYAKGFWALLPQLVIAVVWLVFVWFAVAVATYIVRRVTRNLRGSLQELAALLVKVFLWAFGLLIAATIAFPTLSVGNIFAAAGVGGLAIAFAARDMLENFFAGINLLVRKTFDNGDYVECEGIDGEVEHISIRETQIRQTDGQLVVAPNKTFFQNPLTIRTNRDVRRVTVICGVAYKEDVDKSRDVILKAVQGVDSVEQASHDIQIFAQEFGASSINFEVTWWTGSRPIDIRRSRDQVVAAVKRALDDAGIEIPFPYRTMTFAEPLVIENRNGGQSDDTEPTKEEQAAG